MNLRILSALLVIAAVVMPSFMRAEKIVLFAGGGAGDADGPAVRARLMEPFAVDLDRAGNAFIMEMEKGGRLLKVDTRGVLSHVGGRAAPGDSGDDGPVLSAQFNGAHNLAVLPDGDVLIADTWNGRIRRVWMAKGVVTTLPGFSVPAARARTSGPYCITLDHSGNELYIASLRSVHAVTVKTGRMRLVAGNGEKGVPADGALAAESPLFDARAVAPDRLGNVYILERNGHALRVVSRDGKIRTVVNAAGVKGSQGDGGDALKAAMSGPKHLCIDRENNVIIADTENNLIRKYEPATGRITRVAGTGKAGSEGLDGPPDQCALNRPHGVAVDQNGVLYIVDSYNNRVLKIVR